MKTGKAVKHRILTEKQLAALRKNAWKPGQSGNPRGRPKIDPTLRECLYFYLRLKCLPHNTGIEGFDRAVQIAQKIFGAKPQTYRELLAMMMIIGGVIAAGKGNVIPAKEIREIVDGKTPQPVEISGADGRAIEINIPALLQQKHEQEQEIGG